MEQLKRPAGRAVGGDPAAEVLHAIQDRRAGQALEALERLVGDSAVDRTRLLAAAESLYALEDGMTRDQQDRLLRLERRLRAGGPAGVPHGER